MKRRMVWWVILGLVLSGCDSSSLMNPDATQTTEPTAVTVQSGLISFVEGTVELTEKEMEGTWADPEGGEKLILESGNVVMVERIVNGEYIAEQGRWVLDDNGLTLTDEQGGTLEYKLVTQDGQIRIMGSGSVLMPLEQESLLSQEVNYLGLGETAATDLVKLTLNGIEFATAVSLEPGDYLLPDPCGACAAQKGDLMACLSFRVQNLMEEGLSGQDYCNMSVEYDHDCQWCGGYYGTLQGPDTDIPAKSRADLRAVIECPEAVGEENEVSLCINLTLPSSEGEVQFTYVLK